MSLTTERGSYLANSLSGCGECHTQGVPGAPLGRDNNLKLVTAHYLTGGNVFIAPPAIQVALHQNRAMASNLRGARFGFFHEPGVTFHLFDEIIDTETHADENPPRPLGFDMPAELVPPAARRGPARDLHVHDPHHAGPHLRRAPAGLRAMARGQRRLRGGRDLPHGCGSEGRQRVLGHACTVDADCDACQTCGARACVAPAPDSACLPVGG